MVEQSYREPDYSLQRRIQNHEFGKVASALWLAPFHFHYALWQTWLTTIVGITPQQDDRGVVIPISKFTSYYRRDDETV